MKALKFFSIATLTFLASCAPIQQTSTLSQPTNKTLVAGVGDEIIRVYNEKNLPNAFGASDIFGRKTPTGIITVQYLGVNNNHAIFKRRSLAIESGATTMNSTTLIIPNTQTTTHSGQIYGNTIGNVSYSGVSTTELPPTVIPANRPREQVMDQGDIKISVDLRQKEKSIIVAGKSITIKSADSSKVTYVISE